MPQMSPMYWLLLMFYFMSILILMLMFIYFSFLVKPTTLGINYFNSHFDWKW